MWVSVWSGLLVYKFVHVVNDNPLWEAVWCVMCDVCILVGNKWTCLNISERWRCLYLTRVTVQDSPRADRSIENRWQIEGRTTLASFHQQHQAHTGHRVRYELLLLYVGTLQTYWSVFNQKNTVIKNKIYLLWLFSVISKWQTMLVMKWYLVQSLTQARLQLIVS